MSRITTRLQQLKEQGKTALIPFITAGDPTPGLTVPLLHAMVEAGADIIELGVPFSDPMADGPVIQRASERAIENGIGIRDVLAMVSEFRRDDQETPVVIMGYLNPIEVMGYAEFSKAAAEAGADGVLTVDLPPEEADEFLQALQPEGIDPIFLIAPTSTRERIRLICNTASGFVYYVALKGITGSSNFAIDAVAAKVAEIRQESDLPVGIGFGIKDAASAKAAAQVGDAVIVGSAIVSRVEKLLTNQDAVVPEIKEFLSTLRTSIDSK